MKLSNMSELTKVGGCTPCLSRSRNRNKWQPVDLVLFLTFTSIWGASLGYQEQKFAVEPQDQNALVGSRVTLACRVTNRAGIVQWTKNEFGLGTHRNLSGFNRYSMTGSDEDGDYNLEIQDVRLEDDGLYQCQVSAGAHGELPLRSRSAQLSVLVPPEPPRILQGAFIDAFEMQPVEIECVSYGGKPAAEIIWLDGNQQLITSNIKDTVEVLKDGYTTQTRSVLRLVPTMENHNHTITCQAQNSADRDARMATILVEVKYAPKMNVSLKSELPYLREGTEARILCEVDANPPPQIYRWYINGNPVIGDYNEEMVIFNVTRKLNNAEIRCEVSNTLGKNDKSIVLEVTYSPSFRMRPANVEATAGSSITLSCDVDGQPQPEITWLYHEPGRITVKGKTPNLNIYVTNETAGRYICKAFTKGYPEIESETTVFMKGPPQMLSNKTQFGFEGDNAKIECLALSVPKPDDIRWYFEGREISIIQDPDYATLEEYLPSGLIKSNLVIKASQLKHFGSYNCSVTNEFGNANTEIVLKPLKILPLFIILIGVTSGIVIFSAFIVLLVICNRRWRQNNNNQKNEKPDVTATSQNSYKDSDRNSISDLKLQITQLDGNYELDYSSSEHSTMKLPVGVPMAGPVHLPSIRHADHLYNFRYSNDYSDLSYSDPIYKDSLYKVSAKFADLQH